MASLPMGTNLSLSPLPITLIKPTSKYKQLIFKFTSSLTRKPQLYKVSSIALLRPPSGVLKSIWSIIFSISSKLNVSGNMRFSFGASNKTVGSVAVICSSKQYL